MEDPAAEPGAGFLHNLYQQKYRWEASRAEHNAEWASPNWSVQPPASADWRKGFRRGRSGQEVTDAATNEAMAGGVPPQGSG